MPRSAKQLKFGSELQLNVGGYTHIYHFSFPNTKNESERKKGFKPEGQSDGHREISTHFWKSGSRWSTDDSLSKAGDVQSPVLVEDDCDKNGGSLLDKLLQVLALERCHRRTVALAIKSRDWFKKFDYKTVTFPVPHLCSCCQVIVVSCKKWKFILWRNHTKDLTVPAQPSCGVSKQEGLSESAYGPWGSSGLFSVWGFWSQQLEMKSPQPLQLTTEHNLCLY